MDVPRWQSSNFIATKSAPLATFAMYAEVEAERLGTHVPHSIQTSNLSRPTVRDSEPAKQTATGKEPALLKVLAEKGKPGGKKPPAKRAKTQSSSFLLDE